MTKSNKNKSEKPEKMPDRSSFDAIFSPGSDDPDHMIGMALVNRFGYGNDIYLEGFHEAAETLFDSLGDSHSANILVYPLIFLLRHSIELSLKQTILELRRLNRRTRNVDTSDLFRSHVFTDLTKLLMYEISACHDLNYKLYKEKLDDISDFLGIWESADPEGYIFRYATDRQGKIWLPDVNISCRNIYGFSDWVYWFLFGLRVEIKEAWNGLAKQ